VPQPYKTIRFEPGQIPDGLRREHRLKPDVHGTLRVIEGSVVYVDDAGRRALSAGDTQAIAPDHPHHLEDADDAAIEITFLR